MELTRLAVASISGLLLCGGYLASVNAYFSGDPYSYAARIQESPVPMMSLVILAAVVILGFIPATRGEEEDPE